MNIKLLYTSFKYYYKYLGIRLFFLLVLNLLVGFFDGLGIAMFFPLLQMLGENDGSGNHPVNGGFIYDLMNKYGISLELIPLLLLMILFFALKGASVFINENVKIDLEYRFIQKMRHTLFAKLNQISFNYFMKSDMGRIQNTMTTEVTKVVGAFNSFFSLVQQMMLVVIFFLFAFVLNPTFAVFVTLGGLLSSILFNQLYKNTKSTSIDISKLNNELHNLILQHSANYKYLKATASLDKYGKKIDTYINDIESSTKKLGLIRSILLAAREPILVVIVVITIIVEISFFHSNLGFIVITLMFFYRSLSYLFLAQGNFNHFLGVSGSIQNIEEFQQELTNNKEKNGELDFNHLESEIKLVNVVHKYEDKMVLDHINLTIEKNSTTAIVGVSGSGKTTLINLIARLIEPTSGSIFIDLIDLDKINKLYYQRKVGYITQESVIFNDTIFNNVTFWDEPNAKNIERFNRALNLANISEYVNSLPDKELAILGNSGINLSGGQRQRISIARELYKEVEILIMDEATSALDSESENMIRQNIDSLKGAYTIILVAHRLSTIKSADRIILLNDGKIGFQGTFNELNVNVPEFRRMVELQSL